MTKHLHEILLKDIILLDATKSAKSLMRYSFVPLFLVKKDVEKLTKEIFDLIGNKTVDNIQDEFDKLLSYRKLQLLEALYKAINIEIGLKARINAWKIILEKDYKESEQLLKVIEEVRIHTGIEIKTPESLEEFKCYVRHKADKYQEMYPVEEKQEGVSLIKVVYSVFNYLNEPFNENMRLITFVEMKQLAEAKVKQSKTTDNEE